MTKKNQLGVKSGLRKIPGTPYGNPCLTLFLLSYNSHWHLVHCRKLTNLHIQVFNAQSRCSRIFIQENPFSAMVWAGRSERAVPRRKSKCHRQNADNNDNRCRLSSPCFIKIFTRPKTCLGRRIDSPPSLLTRYVGLLSHTQILHAARTTI